MFLNNGESSYRRFLAGDDDGMLDIVTEYRDGLMLYLNGFVNNLTVAEDLAEDTFVKLAIKKPKFKNESSFKTWLYAIGRNLTLDYIKKNSKEIFSDSEIELKAFDYFEDKIIILNALNKLNTQYRQILILTYFEDFTNKEAAKIMKKSVHSIETLLYRARTALKAVLIKEGYNEKL